MEDQIWRAVGTLKTARLISSSEATQLLSLLQLGIITELMGKQIDRKEVYALFLLIQPAHLQKLTGRQLDATERDVQRAKMIREKLSKLNL